MSAPGTELTKPDMALCPLLAGADISPLIAKISSIGFDLSKSKPDLNKAVATVFETANHNK
jgi:hypothetical protein